MRRRVVAVAVAACASSLATAFAGCGLSPLLAGPDLDGGGEAAAPAVCAAPQGCVPVESGWDVVVLEGQGDAGLGSASCRPGWTARRELVVAPRSGSGDCTCECLSVGTNPCLRDTRDVAFRTGAVSCDDGTRTLSIDGGCQPLGFTWDTFYNGARASAPTPAKIACGARAALPPVLDDGRAVLCSPEGSGSSACGEGSACVVQSDSMVLCVLRQGSHACPKGYPSRRVVVDPSGVVDQRGCGACSCTSKATACTNAGIGFFGTADCSGTARAVSLTGSCNSISGSGTPTHYRYQAAPDTTDCEAADTLVPVTGSVSTPGALTLCCER